MRIFFLTNLFSSKDRALALRMEREERALRAEEAGLELLHRASGSGVRRSAVELRRAHHRQLQINERRKLSVPPPPPSSVSSTSSLEERGQAAVQPALPVPEDFPLLHLLQVISMKVPKVFAVKFNLVIQPEYSRKLEHFSQCRGWSRI
jgi:hypothetical protein